MAVVSSPMRLWSLMGGYFDSPFLSSRQLHENSLLISPWNPTEHVLRNSSNDSTINGTTRIKRSSSIVTNPYDGFEPPPNDDFYFRTKRNNRSSRSRQSPTPSMKRGKAERLLKEHGSPPGVRVTAGGRIVPDGLSPLTSPRFPQFSKYELSPQIPKLHPENIPSMEHLRQIEGFLVSCGGAVCQVVNGSLQNVGYQDGKLQLYMPPANMRMSPTTAVPVEPFGAPAAFISPPIINAALRGVNAPANSPPDYNESHNAHQLRSLEHYHIEHYHILMEIELRELDRNEVLHRDSLTSIAREEIVKRRIGLINRLDSSRKCIAEMKRAVDKESTASAPQSSQAFQNVNVVPVRSQQALQHTASLPMTRHYSFEVPPQTTYMPFQTTATNGQPIPMLEPTYNPNFTNFPYVPPARFATAPNGLQEHEPSFSYDAEHEFSQRIGNGGIALYDNSQSRHQEAHASSMKNDHEGAVSNDVDRNDLPRRRSHAVTIKAPNELDKKLSLNPTSPAYQPSNNMTHAEIPEADRLAVMTKEVDNLVKSPNMTMTEPAISETPVRSNPHGRQANNENVRFRESSSSATTADFFPHDAHHHSANKYSYDGRDGVVNLQNWMANGPIVLTSGHDSTPLRAANKFAFDCNDSPEDDCYSNAPSTTLPQFSDDNQGKRQSLPVQDVLERAGERVSLLREQQDAADSPYMRGFAVGMNQEVPKGLQDDDYYQGYRDGIMRSKRLQGQNTAMSRASSFPTFEVPTVPTNSSATSPQNRSFAEHIEPLSAARSLDRAPNRQDSGVAFSQTKTTPRKIGTRTSGPLRPVEQTSPLANRVSGNSPRNVGVIGSGSSYSARMSSFQSFDQQRFAKGSTLTEASGSHAKGWFPQHDGTNNDDKNSTGLSSKIEIPASSKVTKGSGSPIKRAVVSLANLARSKSPTGLNHNDGKLKRSQGLGK